MRREELDELLTYAASRTAIEESATRKSPAVNMAVLRMIVASLIEKMATRLREQDERLAGVASASRVSELAQRVEALERKLR